MIQQVVVPNCWTNAELGKSVTGTVWIWLVLWVDEKKNVVIKRLRIAWQPGLIIPVLMFKMKVTILDCHQKQLLISKLKTISLPKMFEISEVINQKH